MGTGFLRRLAIVALFLAAVIAWAAALASDDPVFLALPARTSTFLLVAAILGVIGALFFEIRLPRPNNIVLALVVLWAATPITLAMKHAFMATTVSRRSSRSQVSAGSAACSSRVETSRADRSRR